MTTKERNCDEELQQRDEELQQRDEDRRRTAQHVQKRRDAWRESACQKIYRRLITAAGGEETVRPGKRGRAKEIAITAFLGGSQPDVDAFVKEVNLANERYAAGDFAPKRAARARRNK